MRMLDDLKERFELSQIDNEWEYNFIQDMLIKTEENPDFKCSQKQFERINQIHQKYCKGWA